LPEHLPLLYQLVFFGFEDDVNFAIVFGLTLIGFYIFRGGVNLTYNYVMAHFTEELYARTTKRLFKIYLAMPYQVFANKNSSYLTKAIITEVSLMSLVVRSALMTCSKLPNILLIISYSFA
jgi:ABC-type bacteriocin/lantibiotic exporter with double-glycine peptidase domain